MTFDATKTNKARRKAIFSCGACVDSEIGHCSNKFARSLKYAVENVLNEPFLLEVVSPFVLIGWSFNGKSCCRVLVRTTAKYDMFFNRKQNQARPVAR
jgi:hypothetical protein